MLAFIILLIVGLMLVLGGIASDDAPFNVLDAIIGILLILIAFGVIK